MRVFVTGASGFVGRALIRHLTASGWRVTALLLPHESADGLTGAEVLRGDITVPRSLRGTMSGHDAVVHLAGAVGYGQTWDVCQRVNVDGTDNVATEARRAGVRRLVHMSSVSVYGRRAETLLREDAPLRKTGDPYGDTKIDAEAVVRRRAHRAFELVVLRPTVIYGEGDDKFLPKLVENLRSGKARIVGAGTNTVDLAHVDDVARFIALALDDPRAAGRTFNLTNPRHATCTWRELLAVVATAAGTSEPRRHIPYRAALVVAWAMEVAARRTGTQPRLTRYAVRVIGRQYHYDPSAALDLGFTPSVDVRTGVRNCLG